MSTDSNARISTHTNELFARIGIMLFLWIVASIPWLLNIDDILGYFIGIFDPCTEGCLNLYEPEKWAELRWIISGLLGFLTIIPLVNLQIWNFSKPGLTNSEKKLMKNVLILAPVMFLIFSYISINSLLPALYQAGHNVHTNYGFVVKYDAISLMYFATTILWVQLLVIVSTSVMISSGITGNLDVSNANWWRLRVYGFVSLVSLLSYYERTSYGVAITLCTVLIIEVISRPWTTKNAKYNVKLVRHYNNEGEIIAKMKVACTCNNNDSEDMKNDVLLLSNLCSDERIKDDLVKLISRHKPNELTIMDCQNPTAFTQIKQTFPRVLVIVNQ